MKYSKEEVMQYVMEDDVKFIRLAFCDVFGKQKTFPLCLRNWLALLNTESLLMHHPLKALGMKHIRIFF